MGDLEVVLPEYELLGELGRGAMGVVTLARHRSLGRHVAIKELPHAFAADDQVRERFHREARALAALNHPHVVSVYDFLDRSGRLLLVMERLAGGTVWQRFTSDGVTAPAACALLLSTAAGLDHAHRRDVLHRDVKPENLMFTAEGRLKVTDFGMAKVMGGDKTLATADGVVLGTPAYMAPEQAEGSDVGPAADVYACGTMLYELLSGRLPFATASTPMAMLVRRVTDDPPPLQEVAPSVPAGLADVVDRALDRSPRDRFAQVEDFAVALAQAAATAWGPDWMSTTGVTVTGSERIERAARETVDPSATGTGARPRRAETRRAPQTVREDPPSTASHPPLPVVAQEPRRQPVVDLSGITPTQVVDVAELGRPRPVLTPALVAAALVAALAGLLFTGASILDGDPFGTGEDVAGPTEPGASTITIDGQPVGSEPVEVDFASPVVIEGVGSGSQIRLEARSAGVPVGVAEAALSGGRAEIDPSYLRWTTAGVVDVRLLVDGEAEPRATLQVGSASWWLTTAPAVAAIVVGLYGLASLNSSVARRRGRRFSTGATLGLAVWGGVVGAALSYLAAMVQSSPPSWPYLATGAALAAGTAVAVGEANRRRPRRRAYTLLVT